MPVKPLWLVLLVLLSVGSGDAESRDDSHLLNEPRFESIGVGIIPRDVVPTLVQDKAGFFWIATGNGLVRYDGYRFRPQERESQDPVRRNLGWVRAMLPGRDGRLWIGSESDGLAVYDPTSEQVRLCRSDVKNGRGTEAANKLAAPTISALAEDHDGAIWVGSGGGLERVDPGCAKRTHYSHSSRSGSLPDDRVQSLLVDRRGDLWVGTWAGLSYLKHGSDHFEPVVLGWPTGRHIGTNGRIVQALFEASDGRIWVGTQQGDLVVFDPATGRSKVPASMSAATAINHGGVTSFIETPDGRVWVGRSTGIQIFEIQSLQLLQTLRQETHKRTGLAGNEVTTLLLDRSGLIWVGGMGLGLQRHNPNNQSIRLSSSHSQADAAPKNVDARSLLQVDNGEIWVGTPDDGVLVMNAQLRTVGAVHLKSKSVTAVTRERYEAMPVEAMAQSPDGLIWLGRGSELYLFNRKHEQLRVLPHGGGRIRRLLAGRDGTLWVASQDGVYRSKPGLASLVRVNLQDGRSIGGEINAMAEAGDGGVWIGGVAGLFRIAPGGDVMQPVAQNPSAALANTTVIGLLFDRNQTLWVDTAIAGLHRMSLWDGELASFDRVSVRHGTVGRPFGVNLLEDRRGRIWTQMSVYDPQSDRLDELTPAEGADLGTGWFFSYAKTTSGHFLFGGSKGVLVVSPESWGASTYAPPLRVSELRINGRIMSAGGIDGGVTVEPDQRSFSVEFSALDYSDPSRLRYAYRLDGFDPDWVMVGSDIRVASYSNLDPGNYLLRVRATNRSGVWSPHELAIPVRVKAKWWQQEWFRAAALLLVLAAVYALVKLRTRQLRARQLMLEKTVRERTRELKVMSQALDESSQTDELTGLRNRRFITQHIEKDVAMTVRAYEGYSQNGFQLRNDADLVFFLIDIDHFKQVNDIYGHAAGDAVIRQIGIRLRNVFRDSDYLVRWGGEEFMVVARGTSRTYAAELAERTRVAVADHPFALGDGTLLHKTCSIGFACLPLAGQYARALSWMDAVNVADAALYEVKHAGRDGWLGVLAANVESSDALGYWLRRPLSDWIRSGTLEVACCDRYKGVIGAFEEVNLE